MKLSPPNAIDVQNLTITYGQVRAVSDVSFRLPNGRTLGLLGGNGAGKTSTISALLGLVLPTSGRVTMLGHDMARSRFEALPRINFCSPYFALPARLSIEENLRVYGHLYGVRHAGRRIRALADELGLGGLLKRQYGQLSAGQKTRVLLAKSLINEPELLLLDEPTASLDPDTADWVRSLLEDYRTRTGCSILLTSHNMGEVERLCSDVVVLRRGAVIDRNTPAALLERYGESDLESVFLDIARGADPEPAGPDDSSRCG